MMRAWLAALLGGLSAFLPATVAAKEKEEAAIQLLVPPASLQPAKAYVLLKTSTAKSGLFPIQHVFLREPTEQEIGDYLSARQKAYDEALPKLKKKSKDGNVPSVEQLGFDYKGRPNTFVVISKKFLEDGEMRTILLELPPAKYILYGTTVGDGALVNCNCLGTVSFDAKPGIITNLGSLFADKVHKASPIPNLEDNLGEQMFQYGFVLGQALVPADNQSQVPATLKALPVEPAQFEIVEQYYEPGAGGINRLAPIPGLLGYVNGRPVDLRKQHVAEQSD